MQSPLRAIADPAVLNDDPPGDPPGGAQAMFYNREDAGMQLAARLAAYGKMRPLVLGLARGGVPVAATVAHVIGGELDVLVVRKLGSPISDELAIGAVTADGVRVLNPRVVRELGVSTAYIDRVTRTRSLEAEQLAKVLRGGLAPIKMTDRVVIVCDDGLATGATMVAAVRAVRALQPSRLIVAVPVGSREACAILRAEADEVVCLAIPEPFWAVGVYYADFSQTENEEVQRLLRDARSGVAPHAA